MLIFERAIFLHVPKTGGTWVKAAATQANLKFEEYSVDGDIHADLSYCPTRSKFVFAFVREPVSLYRSYWRFKAREGWDDRNPFDVACAAPTLEGFVENVLRLEPAWCSRLFEDYVGPPTAEIDFIGRFESLAADLIRALRRAGESFDERAILDTPPVNASTGDARFPPELAARVRSSEQRCILRFGY
jgi:hypothetical protein